MQYSYTITSYNFSVTSIMYHFIGLSPAADGAMMRM